MTDSDTTGPDHAHETGAALVPGAVEAPHALVLHARADENPAAVYLASLGSAKSRAGMLSALRTLARLLGAADPLSVPWASLRYQHAQALRAKLAEEGAPATANKALCALRGVVREAMRLGLMSAEDCARICDVKAVRGSREPAGRALAAEELRVLFGACDASPAGARDAAILALLYGAGLRRAEVAGLSLADVDTSTGRVLVLGKGNKERTVYATNGSLSALRAWIAARGEEPGALFYAFTAQGAATARGMTGEGVAFALRRVADRAGVEGFSPHDLRRTMIGDLLDAGADIATVQRLAGHASPVTTARYDRRGEGAKLRAASMLRVPFGAAS